jgi:hypothetical protein
VSGTKSDRHYFVPKLLLWEHQLSLSSVWAICRHKMKIFLPLIPTKQHYLKVDSLVWEPETGHDCLRGPDVAANQFENLFWHSFPAGAG